MEETPKKPLYQKTLEKLQANHRKQIEDLAASSGLIHEAEALAAAISSEIDNDCRSSFAAVVHPHHSPAQAVIYVYLDHDEFVAAAMRAGLEIETTKRGEVIKNPHGKGLRRTDTLRFRGFDTPVELEYSIAEVQVAA